MSVKNYFDNPSKEIYPQIYAYSDIAYPGQLKIGYTERKDVEDRMKEHYPTQTPIKPYKVVLTESAIKDNGEFFMDKAVHRYLKKKGFINTNGEWFKCTVNDIRAAIIAIKKAIENNEDRDLSYKMRPEQEKAVELTYKYFTDYKSQSNKKVPHFLWNAKMRFGKTFTTYQLAKKMGWTKILVLSYKTAVESAWKDDLERHIDFEGWQFISKNSASYESINKDKPFVCFGSFQDFLGKNKFGGIKLKNEWAHLINWDCIVLDEYHFGAWRDDAKELVGIDFEAEKEGFIPLTTDHYLYLSGTPFRALSNGEFIEEQIFNWTYSDEQNAKNSFQGEKNPYLSLPRMVMLTYKVPEKISNIALSGEFNEFDLNIFFKAEGEQESARFIYENEVQKWLDLIRGSGNELENLKVGSKKPPLPFEDVRLLNSLTHTLWYLPNVSSCYAMKNLLEKPSNKFYHDYNIVVAAGTSAGIGIKAIDPLNIAMENPLETKTITLTCSKLTTGVTIAPWSGIFMLRNIQSPESYFQSAFRVQSPWVIPMEDGSMKILKENCYIFDFAPDRALRQIAEYSCKLNVENISPEKKVEEFTNFLPVLSYDGMSMKEIDAEGILDYVLSGTTASLLARRWESALLVNVDNATLERLKDNIDVMNRIMNIEAFRSLNKDIETIINKSKAINEVKTKSSNEDLGADEAKKLKEDTKERNDLRNKIQEKLIKLATRIPIFMYLTDNREETLESVICSIEPALFKKVTGLTVEDFKTLKEIGVFNGPVMNQAVFNFKRYEDSSITYSGINKHAKDGKIGGWDTVIAKEEFESIR